MELNFSNFKTPIKNERKKIENFAEFLSSRTNIKKNINKLDISKENINDNNNNINEKSTDYKLNLKEENLVENKKLNFNESNISDKTIVNSLLNYNNNNSNNFFEINTNIKKKKVLLDINYQKLYKLLTNVYSKLIESLFSFEEYNKSFEYRILPSFSNFFKINFNLTKVDIFLPEFYKMYNYELINLILIDIINKISISDKIGNEIIHTTLKVTTKIYENYLYLIYFDENSNNNFSKKRCMKLFKSYFTNIKINQNYKCDILSNIYYIKYYLEDIISILIDCFNENLDKNTIFKNRQNNYSNTPFNLLSILSDLLNLINIESGHENFNLYEKLKEQFQNLIFKNDNIPFNARNTYSNYDSLNYMKFSKKFTIIFNIDDILYIYENEEFTLRTFLYEFFKQVKIDYNIILISSLNQQEIINLINLSKIKDFINSIFLYKNNNKENRIIITSLKDILNKDYEKIKQSDLLIIDNLELTIFPYYSENILNISYLNKKINKNDNTLNDLYKILYSFTHNNIYKQENDIRKILSFYYENNN